MDGSPQARQETIKFKGKLFEIVDKTVSTTGKEFVIEAARRAPGARLILDPGDGSLLLTKEYRAELGGYDYRVPGGKVYDSLVEYRAALESGSDLAPAIEAAARKEAKEEAGIEGGSFSKFHTSVLGLSVEWDLHYFVVTGFSEGAQDLGEHEDIEVVRVPKEEVRKMCLDGTVSEERSALVLLRYLDGK